MNDYSLREEVEIFDKYINEYKLIFKLSKFELVKLSESVTS